VTRDVLELRWLLRGIAIRLGIAAASRVLSRAAAVAGGALLLWALLTAIVPVPFPLGPVAAALAGALVVAGFVLTWRLRPPLGIAAQIADRGAGLADRLSTAVELLARPAPLSGLARLQVADAVERSQGVAARAVAPLQVPGDAWIPAVMCVLLAGWAVFLAGWSLPATPAARTVAAIHREGESLLAIGRRLETVGRSGGLPEARRVAPLVQAFGRRLESPRIDREQALGLLRGAGRDLTAAQAQVQRQLDAALPQGRPAGTPPGAAPSAQRGAESQALQRLDAAVRQVQSLTGQLQRGGAPVDPQTLSTQLRALSDSLDDMNVPVSARQSVERARRDAAQGHLAAASRSLGDALQDLQGFERMLGDEQEIGDARQDVQRSASRLAAQGPLGGADLPVQGEPSPNAPPPTAPGPNPPSPSADQAAAPPPPGPNQGSLPGQGTGPGTGAPTGRLGGTRTPEQLNGIVGSGGSAMKEIVGPGRAGASGLSPTRLPANAARQIDQAMSQTPLPPAYLVLVRQYFETFGGAP